MLKRMVNGNGCEEEFLGYFFLAITLSANIQHLWRVGGWGCVRFPGEG